MSKITDAITAMLEQQDQITTRGVMDAHPEISGVNIRGTISAMLDRGQPKIIGGDAATFYTFAKAESSDGDIFEQCRKNWSGYQIHKIFGSAGRVST